MISIDSLLQDPNAILVVGKRGSGKSLLCKFLIFHWSLKKLFGSILIFSNTIRVNNTFDFVKDESLKYEKFDPEITTQAMAYQKHQIEKVGLEKTKMMLIVLDDINTSDTHNSEVLDSLFTHGRHLKIAVICSLQFSRMISPCARANFDYLLMSCQVGSNAKILKEMVVYSSKSIPFEDFIDKHTENFRFLIYNNKSKSKADRWSTIKAEPIKNFTLKLPEMKKLERRTKGKK